MLDWLLELLRIPISKAESFGKAVKGFNTSRSEVQTAVNELKASQPLVERALKDIQRDVSKMNFKNKPHLARMDETLTHLKATLDRSKKK